jgi:hypothetical protein
MDPCVFYKIIEDNEGKVISYIVVITWVDDCRFFGTPDLIKEYEETIAKNCKCTLEGVSREFVSIEITHKVAEGILELTRKDYWVKAVERFKSCLPPSGQKDRKVPLSPADEKLLIEPSDSDVKLAEHLPYASLLGVCQYPSSFTKLEMRYALSVLSRHRTRWGMDHFKALLKALEYGFSSRHFKLNNPDCLDPVWIPTQFSQPILTQIQQLPEFLKPLQQSRETVDLKLKEQYNYLRQYFERTGTDVNTINAEFNQYWIWLEERFK